MPCGIHHNQTLPTLVIQLHVSNQPRHVLPYNEVDQRHRRQAKRQEQHKRAVVPTTHTREHHRAVVVICVYAPAAPHTVLTAHGACYFTRAAPPATPPRAPTLARLLTIRSLP